MPAGGRPEAGVRTWRRLMIWKRTLVVLGIGVILSGSGYTMIVPFLPLYLVDLGVDEASLNMWSGTVFAVSFFVSGVLSPYWGRLADKAGKRRMLIRSGLSLATVYFLTSLVQSPAELLAARVLQGVAVGFVSSAMAIVATVAPKEKIGFSLGFMQAANLTGTILGPAAGGTLAHLFGIRTSFEVAATVVLVATIGVWILVPEPPVTPAGVAGSVAGDLRAAIGNPLLRRMLAILFLVQMVAIMLQPLITLYIAEMKGTFAGASLAAGAVFSLAGVAGAIAAPAWGNAGQRYGFIKMIAVAMTGCGVVLAAQFFSHDIVRFAALHFVFGLFLAGTYPNVNSAIVTCTDESFRGRAFGLAMSANQFGAMTGPLLGGAISTVTGIGIVFVADGLLLTAVAVALIWRCARPGSA
jgi:DHA1 family multidrug resistance protein-like MFS transporter